MGLMAVIELLTWELGQKAVKIKANLYKQVG